MSETSKCPVCDGLVRGGVLCKGHRRELAEALHTIRLDLYALQRAERREVRLGGEMGRGGNRAYPRSPISEPVADFLDSARRTLADVGATVGLWRSSDPMRLVRAMQSNVGGLSSCPECSDNHRRLTRMASSMEDWCAPEGETVVLGPCPNPDCGDGISATRGAVEAECRSCGCRWSVAMLMERRRERLESSDDVLTPRAMVELLRGCGFDVSVNTIRSWARRGRLEERGEGRHAYRLGDVISLCGNTN